MTTIPSCPCCGSASNTLKAQLGGGCSALECNECSVVFTHPLSGGSSDKVGASHSSVTDSEYYAGIVSGYNIQETLARQKVRNLLEQYATKFNSSPKTVLEIGCGTGSMYRAWSESKVEWLGVETSPEMLSFCKEHGKPVLPADEMGDLPEGKYDLIYFSQVLEHILDPRAFLAKIKPLLSSNGFIHLDVPNHDGLIPMIRRIAPSKSSFGFIQLPHHLIAYTDVALRKLLKNTGFEVLMMGAYSNNHKVFGQNLVNPSPLFKFLMEAGTVTGRGSLLVACARPVTITN